MDDNEEFDSTKHHAKRKAKIQTENKQNEAAARETADDKEIANFDGIVKDGETREQLLDRIRAMREETPKEVEHELVRSPGLQKAFEAEQKAGQEAVAKAKAELELSAAAWQKVEAEEEKKSRSR